MAAYWNKPGRDRRRARLPKASCAPATLRVIDERGFIYIVDRKKDMIIVSGFNVYPNEVEEVVMMHPGVGESPPSASPTGDRAKR